MNKSFINALKALGCDIEPGWTLKSESSVLLTVAEVGDWWTTREQEEPTGWIQFSDVNVWFIDGKPTPAGKPKGLILAAELTIKEVDEPVRKEISYHLRQTGQGWVTAKITRKPDLSAFIETRRFLHSVKGLDPLSYEVAWGGTPLQATAFRLTHRPS